MAKVDQIKILSLSIFLILISLSSQAANLSALVGGCSKVKYMGKTTATFTGNLGGALGANAKCQVDFPGSHFCNYSEFLQTGEAGAIGSLWLSGIGFAIGGSSYATEGCRGWSSTSSAFYGATTTTSSVILDVA